MVRTDCISNALTSMFYRWGKFVARHPLPWILFPLVVTALCQLGWIRARTETDVEYLYVPEKADSFVERSTFETYFPYDDVNRFTPTRQYYIDGFLQVIIVKDDGGNVYTDEGAAEMLTLHQTLMSVTLDYQGLPVTYYNICAAWEGQCSLVPILSLLQNASVQDLNLTFPMHEGQIFLANQFGAPKLDRYGHLESAEAFLLWYYVNSENYDLSFDWLEKVKDLLLDYHPEGYRVVFQVSQSLEQELEKASFGGISSFAITFTVLFTFAVFSCMTCNPVTCKPWVAFAGEAAALLASISSLGLLSLGIPLTTMAGITPFLIAGIGLDDTFIVISCWRNTPSSLPVEERVGRAMKDAAVSVTLTSLTDALAFGIGAITPFRSVRFFCLYTTAAIAFCYVYVLTLLTACLTYSGRREAANKSVITCKTVSSKKYQTTEKSIKVEDKGNAETENTNEANTDGKDGEMNQMEREGSITSVNEEEEENPLWINRFLSGPYVDFISLTPVRIFILLLYAAYIGVAAWGFVRLQEGLDLKNLAPTDSYVVDFFTELDKYYRSVYGPEVMCLIKQPLDYTDPRVLNDISNLEREFTSSSYFFDNGITNWLSRFQTYLSFSNRSVVDFSGMPDFIQVLRSEFLDIPAFQYFMEDVQFNENFTEVTASRFFAQGLGGVSTVHDKNLMLTARSIARNSALNVTVYNPYFLFFDQFAVIIVNTIQNTGIALACMLFTALLLIPSLIAVIWVTLAVLSICAGIVGYMVLWGVSLDSVSMIALIMCIGFSVDFAAHISYHFVVSKRPNNKDKTRDALRELGYPIIQAGVSTLLGVVVLSTTNSYIFQTFFKVVTLVMLFGFFHSLVVLPVIMPLVSCQGGSTEKKSENSNNSSNRPNARKGKALESPAIGQITYGLANPSSNENEEIGPYVTKIDLKSENGLLKHSIN